MTMAWLGWNRSNNGDCPCNGCTEERYPGCHDHCPKYPEWRKKVDARREAEKREQESHDVFSDAKKKEIWRSRRYGKKRNNRINDRYL